MILPDVLRWLWRDYPTAIKSGISQNSTLQEVTIPTEHWVKLPQLFSNAAGLTADSNGEVYVADESEATVYRIGVEGKRVAFSAERLGISGEAFGPDGTLYGVIPAEKRIVSLGADGRTMTVASGITGHSIVVTHDGTIYVTEPGAHSDMPSRVWEIKSGTPKIVDSGLSSASGVAFSPDGSLLYVAEQGTKWIYSYVVEAATLSAKQPFYWLHTADIENDSGAQDLAVDTHGNLYVATRMGIQICDQNGRVRAILPLPTPSGPVRNLCFGGKQFDILYVTDGKQVFMRRLRVRGHPQWAPPIPVPSQGAG